MGEDDRFFILAFIYFYSKTIKYEKVFFLHGHIGFWTMLLKNRIDAILVKMLTALLPNFQVRNKL